MSTINKRKWYNYIFETQDDSYVQKLYKVPLRLKVRKIVGGNKSETEDEIRAISTVTSLSLPRDRKKDSENWYMTYDVKFELPPERQGELKRFVNSTIVPDVSSIDGVEVLAYGEAFQVYDAQDDTVANPEKARSKIYGGDSRRQSKGDEDVE